MSLLEGEQVAVEDLGIPEPSVLANTSALKRGLVLRSSSNQVSIHLSREQRQQSGSLMLRYQGTNKWGRTESLVYFCRSGLHWIFSIEQGWTSSQSEKVREQVALHSNITVIIPGYT